jgi:hypothetical protein
LYICFWVGLILIAIFAFNKGNPSLLAAPFDSSGTLNVNKVFSVVFHPAIKIIRMLIIKKIIYQHFVAFLLAL